jgi:hypothetical protein
LKRNKNSKVGVLLINNNGEDAPAPAVSLSINEWDCFMSNIRDINFDLQLLSKIEISRSDEVKYFIRQSNVVDFDLLYKKTESMLDLFE